MTQDRSATVLAGRKIAWEQGQGPEVWVKVGERGTNVAWGRLMGVDGDTALVAGRDGDVEWVDLARIEFRAEQEWGRARPIV